MVLTPDGRFGFIDPQKIELLQHMLVTQGLLKKSLPQEDIFTPDFVEAVYRR